jgi:hypothetical protein
MFAAFIKRIKNNNEECLSSTKDSISKGSGKMKVINRGIYM